MNKRIIFPIYLCALLTVIFSCVKNSEINNITQKKNKETTVPKNTQTLTIIDSIKANFKKLNSIEKWDKIVKIDLDDTTEGGEANYYYLNNQLAKIVVKQYGENFQLISEYYTINNQLSFVYEKMYQYNRPITYDSVMMKENGDNEIFDFDKSEIVETRSYFDNEQLIQQISNDAEKSTAKDLINDYKYLLGLME